MVGVGWAHYEEEEKETNGATISRRSAGMAGDERVNVPVLGGGCGGKSACVNECVWGVGAERS